MLRCTWTNLLFTLNVTTEPVGREVAPVVSFTRLVIITKKVKVAQWVRVVVPFCIVHVFEFFDISVKGPCTYAQRKLRLGTPMLMTLQK